MLDAPARWFRYMGSSEHHHFLREHEIFCSFIPVPDRVWQRNIKVDRHLMSVVPERDLSKNKDDWTTEFEIRRDAEQSSAPYRSQPRDARLETNGER